MCPERRDLIYGRSLNSIIFSISEKSCNISLCFEFNTDHYGYIRQGLLFNDVTVLEDGSIILRREYNNGGGGKSKMCQKLRDLIYGRSLNSIIFSKSEKSCNISLCFEFNTNHLL